MAINNLVVDMLAMDEMKAYAPVIFDATHALQKPGGRTDSADGRRAQAAQACQKWHGIRFSRIIYRSSPKP